MSNLFINESKSLRALRTSEIDALSDVDFHALFKFAERRERTLIDSDDPIKAEVAEGKRLSKWIDTVLLPRHNVREAAALAAAPKKRKKKTNPRRRR